MSTAEQLNEVVLPVGTMIADRYRVTRRLGRGGMASVYEVEHVHIGRRFACKIVGAAINGGPHEQALFREAKLLGRFESEHIVKIVDCGRDPIVGSYLVVEKFPDGTLAELVALQGRVSWDRAVSIMLSICAALADVHRADVVHRDLKPQNIGLCNGGHTVKLFDFGIAGDGRSEETDLRVLGSGTLPYMAPELWAGKTASVESDLFALGVTLCEMITGTRIFDGRSAPKVEQAELVAKIKEFAPDAQIPGWLTHVIARLLHRSPQKRFHSTAELASALRRTNAYDYCSTLGFDDEVTTGTPMLAAMA